MPSLGDIRAALKLDTSNFTSNAASARSELKSLGGDLVGMGKQVTLFAAPFAALGVAAMAASSDVNAAYRVMRVGTGAVGDDLNALKSTFNTVFAEVPSSARDAATAITELSRRTGAVGDDLKALAKAELELSHITESDLKEQVVSTTQAFNRWGVATSDQTEMLNVFFRISQATGISVTTLAQQTAQAGPTFKQLGFGIEETAAILGSFDKAGISADTTIAGLTKGLQKMAKEGVTDPVEAFKQLSERMKGANTDFGATEIAVKYFGRSAVAMGDAIRSGKLDVEALMDSLKNSKDTIGQAVEDTRTFGETMTLLRHNVELALAPLGREMTKAMKDLVPLFEDGVSKLTDLAHWFGNLEPETKKVIGAMVLLAGAIGPALIALGGLAKSLIAVSEAMTLLSATKVGALATGFSGLGGAAGLFAVAAVGAFAAAELKFVQMQNRFEAGLARMRQQARKAAMLGDLETKLQTTPFAKTALVQGMTVDLNVKIDPAHLTKVNDILAKAGGDAGKVFSDMMALRVGESQTKINQVLKNVGGNSAKALAQILKSEGGSVAKAVEDYGKPFTDLQGRVADAAAGLAGTTKKAGAAAGQALLQGFKDGAAGLDQALALLTANQTKLPDLFTSVGKSAKAGMQQLAEGVKVGATALNEFFQAAGVNAKVSAEQIAANFAKFKPSLDIADAWKHLNESINNVNLERVVTGLSAWDSALQLNGKTISISFNLFDELKAKFPEIVAAAEKAGFSFKQIFPAMTRDWLDWLDSVKTPTSVAEEQMDRMTKNFLNDLKQQEDSFKKTADAAPHWAGAIVDSAAAVKKAMENTTEIVRTKAALEMGQSFDAMISDAMKLGEQMGKTGDDLLKFATGSFGKMVDELKTKAPEFAAVFDTASKDALLRVQKNLYQLPGVLDELFNKLASGAKRQVSGLFDIINGIPGAFGDALRKSTSAVTTFLSQIDLLFKGLHKLFQDVPDGLSGVISSIVGLFKKMSDSGKSSVDAMGGSLDDLQKKIKNTVQGTQSPTTGIAGIGSAAKGTSKTFGEAFSAMGGALASFATAVAVTAGTGSKTMGFLSSLATSALAGVQAGLAFGPVGGAIVGGISLIGGLIGTLMGKSPLQKAQDALALQQAKDGIRKSQEEVLQLVEQTKQSWLTTLDQGRQLLESISFYSRVPKVAFNAFFSDIGKLFSNVVDLAKTWKLDATADIKAAAENLKAGVELVAALPAALEGISKYLGVPQSSIDRFFSDVTKLLDAFSATADQFTKAALKHISKFANLMKPAVDLWSSAVSSITGMFDLKDIPPANFDTVKNAINQIVLGIADVSNYFEKWVLKQVGFFGQTIAPAVDLWKNAIDAIKAMVDVPVPSAADFRNLFDSIKSALSQMSDLAAMMDTEMLLRAQAISQAAMPIFDAIKTAVESLGALRDYKAVGSETFKLLLSDFNQALQMMVDMDALSARFITLAQIFEQNIQAGADHLKNAIAIFQAAIKNLGFGLGAFGVSVTFPSGGEGDVGTTSASSSSGGGFAPSSRSGGGGFGPSAPAPAGNTTNYFQFGGLTVNGDDPRGRALLEALADLFGPGTGLDQALSQYGS